MAMKKSVLVIGIVFAAAVAISAYAIFGLGGTTPTRPVGQSERSLGAATVEIADPIRGGRTEPLARTPGAIRLATYNVENLFREGENAKPEREMKALADVLRRIDADVVALQEVESEATLRWFLETYASDLGYVYVVSPDAGDARGIEQSVISRFPLGGVRQWVGERLGGVHPELYGDQPNWEAGNPIAFRRSPLLVEVTVPPRAKDNAAAYRFTLITVHQKSGRHAGYWREAEAGRIMAIIAELESSDPDRNIVLLGDFNAQLWDESVQTYIRGGLTDPFEGDDENDLTSTKVLTHASDRRIDKILYNRAMASEVIRDSRFVLGTPVHPRGADWRNDPRPEGYASDHYPVVIDLWPIEGGR